MFNFLKSKFTNKSANPDADALVEEFARQETRNYSHKLENFTAGVKYKNAESPFQREVVFAMLKWFDGNQYSILNHHEPKDWQLNWKMREIFLNMLKHKLPFSEQHVITLLDWSVNGLETHAYFGGIPQMIKVVGDYLKDSEISKELITAIDRLIRVLEAENRGVEPRRWVLRLKELKGDTEISLPLAAGDVWVDEALGDLRALDPKIQTAWAELLLHCLRVTGSAPSSKWLKGIDKYLEAIGSQDFFKRLLHWFPLVDKPRSTPLNRHDNRQTMLPVNADILKGLVWLCSKTEES